MFIDQSYDIIVLTNRTMDGGLSMDYKALVVDDSRLNVQYMTDILQQNGLKVYSLRSGLNVVEKTHEIKPDIILLDIVMPEIDGFEVCRQLKENYEIKDIPVIMVTSITNSQDLKKALDLGAFDYIKKPIDEDEVLARVHSALRFKQYLDKLKVMATKDGLTGLYNHALLMELLEKEFARNERSEIATTFVMIDVDHFKKINDKYGHLAGDNVLKQLAQLLVESVRVVDIVGRYGGEEFGIIIRESDETMAYEVCERIRQSVEEFDFSLKNDKIHITISMGIYHKPYEEKIDFMEVVRRADKTLYKAKNSGRNRVEIFKKQNS